MSSNYTCAINGCTGRVGSISVMCSDIASCSSDCKARGRFKCEHRIKKPKAAPKRPKKITITGNHNSFELLGKNYVAHDVEKSPFKCASCDCRGPKACHYAPECSSSKRPDGRCVIFVRVLS